MQYRYAIRISAMGLILVLASVAGAQERRSRDCADHRCALELFGMRSIEEHQALGDQVRRVIYTTGKSREAVAITFVQAAGREPTLWVHSPRALGEAARGPMTVRVTEEVWADILLRSKMLDHHGPPATEFNVCSHAREYTVETSDAATSADPAPSMTRRMTANECADSPVPQFADAVARAALQLLPACVALEPLLQYSADALLAACGKLQGDRMAAAQVMKLAEGLYGGVDYWPDDLEEEITELAGLFDDQARVNWNGEHSYREPHRFWASKMAGNGDGEPYSKTEFHVQRVLGETPQRVRLFGMLERIVESAEEGKFSYSRARVEQVWVVGPQQFEIENVDVGTFERAR